MIEIKEIGIVKDIRQGIARIEGLPSCIFGQMIRFSQGAPGIVIGFNEDEVLVLALGDETTIRSGEEVTGRIEPFRVPVGDAFVGRVVNALGLPVDQKGAIGSNDYYPLFREATGVIDRIPIEESLLTGIKLIDTSLPIGHGQRELIVGDRMTGKTTIVLDTILNQKGKDVVCIYCCIGRSLASLSKAPPRTMRSATPFLGGALNPAQDQGDLQSPLETPAQGGLRSPLNPLAIHPRPEGRGILAGF